VITIAAVEGEPRTRYAFVIGVMAVGYLRDYLGRATSMGGPFVSHVTA
jgi:hypothetical protein